MLSLVSLLAFLQVVLCLLLAAGPASLAEHANNSEVAAVPLEARCVVKGLLGFMRFLKHLSS